MRRFYMPFPIVAVAASMLVSSCAASGTRPGMLPSATGARYSIVRAALPVHDVLYVSDVLDSRVDIYPENTNDPAPIGSIVTEIDTPTGMAVDSSHDLFVGDNETRTIAAVRKGVPNDVYVFKPGAGSPFDDYSQDSDHPTDVAVGADGTVYVASFGDGYVTEYPPGSHTPSLHFQAPSGTAFSLALDAANDLYVACTTSDAVFEFAPGSTNGTNLGLVLGGEPHGMAFDASGDLLVAVSKAPNSGSVIDVFPPGSTTPSKQIMGTFQPFMIALDRSQRHLYVADFGSGNHDGGVFEFAYPSGRLVGKYRQGGASAAYGVAVNPPSSP